jgi:hypothetical protein
VGVALTDAYLIYGQVRTKLRPLCWVSALLVRKNGPSEVLGKSEVGRTNRSKDLMIVLPYLSICVNRYWGYEQEAK